MIQFNSKIILKVHLLNFKEFLIELKGKLGQSSKGKLGQSSVSGLLNNSFSVNLCHYQTFWKLTPSEEKCSSETTSQDSHCHSYALIPNSA